MEFTLVLFLGLLFIGLGLAVSKYKCYWLISGYNTSSKEEKENVDVEQLGKHMGRLMYIITGIIWATVLLSNYLEINIGIVVILSLIIVFRYVIYMQRFDNNPTSKGEKAIIYVIGVVALVILIIVFSVGSEPNKVTIVNDKIVISGSYSRTLKREDVKNIEMTDTMPKVISKSNGYSDGKSKKGEFKLEGDRKGVLYIESKEGPYIKIDMDKYDIYINNKDKKIIEETYKLLVTPGV